jgi:hypothetical protein
MDDKIALEQFLLENVELEKIKSFVSEFNIFEIMRIVHAEIRHSNMLAWLLNPKSNHGFGDQFLRLFLKHLFYSNRETIKTQITFFDIEIFNLNDIEIRREWNKIDLLIVSNANNLVIAIENKIESTEHSDQLNRYWDIITKEFPRFHKLFVYLTPEGLTPADESNWIIFDYGTIHSILMKLLELKRSSLNESVYVFLTQYADILRRYVMGNPEIEEICKKIYQKHREALDLIFQYKPDIDSEISEMLQDLIRKHDNLILDASGKTVIRFTSKLLDDLIPARGEGWTLSKRILLFEFSNYEKRLVLRLYIGPGENEIRNRLHGIAKKDTKLFNKSDRKIGFKWLAIYQKEYLKQMDYEDAKIDGLEQIILEKFSHFMSDDLPKIENHISNIWLNTKKEVR